MSAPELISRLFAARTAAHLAHLQTKSFAAHKALDGFYTDIVDLADSFAETYQGIFGLIETYPNSPMPSGDPVEWIATLRTWMKKSKEASCKGESELQNIHDEICALCASTVYKLKYLDNPVTSGTSIKNSVDAEEFLEMDKW